MARYVKLKHSVTGEVKELKVGWSWPLFLFSGFWGLPLFLRKLPQYGIIFLAIGVISFIMPEYSDSDLLAGNALILLLSYFGLSIWLAIQGNELTGKVFLENGWVFSEKDSDDTKYAKGKWGL